MFFRSENRRRDLGKEETAKPTPTRRDWAIVGDPFGVGTAPRVRKGS